MVERNETPSLSLLVPARINFKIFNICSFNRAHFRIKGYILISFHFDENDELKLLKMYVPFRLFQILPLVLSAIC